MAIFNTAQSIWRPSWILLNKKKLLNNAKAAPIRLLIYFQLKIDFSKKTFILIFTLQLIWGVCLLDYQAFILAILANEFG